MFVASLAQLPTKLWDRLISLIIYLSAGLSLKSRQQDVFFPFFFYTFLSACGSVVLLKRKARQKQQSYDVCVGGKNYIDVFFKDTSR